MADNQAQKIEPAQGPAQQNAVVEPKKPETRPASETDSKPGITTGGSK